MSARKVAAETLQRIDHQGAYANLVLGSMLERSDLDEADRRFATQLVYGTTRMRRACDHLIDRFAKGKVDPDVRTLLRLGTYQLHWLNTPDHAAVDQTVSLMPRRARGFSNAVLRRVAAADLDWPDLATRCSYPDWLVDLLVNDHGIDDATAMLEQMNREPTVHERSDGYIQDPASQWVCDLVDAQPGLRVLDCCAAPGGKATLLAASGAQIVASDRRLSRARLVTSNSNRTGTDLLTAVADAAALPFASASFDRVLVDAPCSGIGVLRRRADARWRLDPEAPTRLAALQQRLLTAAAEQVRSGGMLIYSVCTVSRSETTDVAATLGGPFEPVPIDTTEGPWRRWGDDGGIVLPHDHDTDGMAVFLWRRS